MNEIITGIILMLISIPVMIASVVVVYRAVTRSEKFIAESLILPVFLFPVFCPLFFAGFFMAEAAYA